MHQRIEAGALAACEDTARILRGREKVRVARGKQGRPAARGALLHQVQS
jgi:hypothetical protein